MHVMTLRYTLSMLGTGWKEVAFDQGDSLEVVCQHAGCKQPRYACPYYDGVTPIEAGPAPAFPGVFMRSGKGWLANNHNFPGFESLSSAEAESLLIKRLARHLIGEAILLHHH